MRLMDYSNKVKGEVIPYVQFVVANHLRLYFFPSHREAVLNKAKEVKPYFIINCAYEQSLEKVEYTDDPKCLSPKMFAIGNEKIELASAKLGKYKNTYWEFQNEERYILRFLPVDVKQMLGPAVNAADIVYKSFINTKDFLPYYDLKISDEAYCSMEITLSPQFSDGNRVILESLCEKYNPNMRISESALRNLVRL